jgi:drug/metabolite transporter (DMT)-like permease
VIGWAGRPVAIAQALLVTVLWSSSWVLVKFGLADLTLPPLSFAGLRYLIAALILLPFGLAAWRRVASTGGLRRVPIAAAVVLGIVLYSITQGAQFAALVHLPAVAVALALSATPVVVAALSVRSTERPRALQVLGALALVAGTAVYLGPLDLGEDALLGLAIAGVGLLANAAAALLGRSLARDQLPHLGGVIGLTSLSMTVGAIVLLSAGLVVEGLPSLTPTAWLVIGWLAALNTAFAFTLWNHSLRTLTALESSMINNLMLIEIAVLAWIFLGETLDMRQIGGLAIAFAGILAVQIRRPRSQRVTTDGVAVGG